MSNSVRWASSKKAEADKELLDTDKGEHSQVAIITEQSQKRDKIRQTIARMTWKKYHDRVMRHTSKSVRVPSALQGGQVLDLLATNLLATNLLTTWSSRRRSSRSRRRSSVAEKEKAVGNNSVKDKMSKYVIAYNPTKLKLSGGRSDFAIDPVQGRQSKAKTIFRGNKYTKKLPEELSQSRSGMVITETTERECKVECLVLLGETFSPKDFEKTWNDMFEFRSLEIASLTFESSLPLQEVGPKDGDVLANVLWRDVFGDIDVSSIIFGHSEARGLFIKTSLDLFIEKYICMKELVRLHPFFKQILLNILLDEGKRVSYRHRVISHLNFENFTEVHGQLIGESFGYYLRLNPNEESGVNTWISQFDGLMAFSEDYHFVAAFFYGLGRKTKYKVTFIILFLSIGSGIMSLIDIGTDVATINYFLESEEGSNKRQRGFLMLFFVVTTVILQVALVCFIHSRDFTTMWREVVTSLTFTKPAFNKFRFLTDKVMRGHERMDNLEEMMFFKITEVFCESIPCTVIHISSIMATDYSPRTLQYVTLLSSVCFVSECVAYMTYMKDTSPEARHHGKIFYGFIPLEGFNFFLMKLSMFFLSFTTLTLKCISYSMAYQFIEIGTLNGFYLICAFWAAEMGIYLLYKVIRGDFFYHMIMDRRMHAIASFFFRLAGKIVTDFTGFVHFRHPYELGGFYWFFTQVLSVAMCFLTFWLGLRNEGTKYYPPLNEDQTKTYLCYPKVMTADREGLKTCYFEEGDLFRMITFLSTVWLLCLCSMLLLCEKNYLRTFFSLMTTKQFAEKQFFEAHDDYIRMQIITKTWAWRHFEDEVRDWLEMVWEDLHAKKPAWFTEELIALIPEDIIPDGDDLNEMSQRIKERNKRKKRDGALGTFLVQVRV